MKGTRIFSVLVLISLAGGAYYWRQPLLALVQGAPAAKPAAAGPAAGMALPVETVKVQSGTVLQTVDAVGTLLANEAVMLRPEFGGRVSAIQFQEGQAVKANQVLISLESTVYKAEVDQAQARLNLSRTNYQRQQSLDQRGLGTEQDRDKAQSEQRVDEASLALAQARWDKMTLRAPFAGVLGLRQISVGDYVSPGQDLVNLLDLDPIKVDFRIPERYLSAVQVGQTLDIHVDAFPGKQFQGQVYAIDPQLDVNGRAVLLRARIPNSELQLKAGLFARVTLILERHENALLLAEASLMPQGSQQFVYKVQGDKVARVPVSIGQRQNGQVEILKGLSLGDEVVSAGQLKLRDGAAVKPLPAKGN